MHTSGPGVGNWPGRHVDAPTVGPVAVAPAPLPPAPLPLPPEPLPPEPLPPVGFVPEPDPEPVAGPVVIPDPLSDGESVIVASEIETDSAVKVVPPRTVDTVNVEKTSDIITLGVGAAGPLSEIVTVSKLERAN